MSAVVLYIEDNPDNVTLVKRAIEAIGHQFVGIRSGIEGVRIAEEIKPDLVLLDINLPDMDGYEVARQMRSCALEHLQYVPIIAISANNYVGEMEKAIEAGCDIYMSKPINIRDLWNRVDNLLETTLW